MSAQQRFCRCREFDTGNPEATLHAMAEEILRYREALRWLAAAVGWAKAGAPFAVLAPGPLWRPRRPIDGADATPSASEPV
jgi:hypothetical protein